MIERKIYVNDKEWMGETVHRVPLGEESKHITHGTSCGCSVGCEFTNNILYIVHNPMLRDNPYLHG